MKKMLVLAMSLLSTSLFASDFRCKIVNEEKRTLVGEGVITAGSSSERKVLETEIPSLSWSYRERLARVAATTYANDEGAIHLSLTVEGVSVGGNERREASTAYARFPIDAERLQASLAAPTGAITAACERVN